MQEIKIIFSFHGRPFFLFISTHIKVSCQCDVILYIIPFSIVHQVRHTLLNYSETTFQFSIHHNYMQSYNAFHEVTQVNKFITYALIIQTMIKTESHCLLLSMATPSFTYCVVGISFRGQGYSQYLAGTSLFDFFLSLIFFSLVVTSFFDYFFFPSLNFFLTVILTHYPPHQLCLFFFDVNIIQAFLSHIRATTYPQNLVCGFFCNLSPVGILIKKLEDVAVSLKAFLSKDPALC